MGNSSPSTRTRIVALSLLPLVAALGLFSAFMTWVTYSDPRPATALGEELVLNGDFALWDDENGNPTNWLVLPLDDPTGFVAEDARDLGEAVDPPSAHLQASGLQPQRLMQNVGPVVGGAEYLFSVHLEGDVETTIDFYDQDGNQIAGSMIDGPASIGPPTPFNMTLTAPNGAASARITVVTEGTSVEGWVDGVSLVQTSEPPVPTPEPTSTSTPTNTPANTNTPTLTPSITPTSTVPAGKTVVATETPTVTPTPTDGSEPTATETVPGEETETPEPIQTPGEGETEPVPETPEPTTEAPPDPNILRNPSFEETANGFDVTEWERFGGIVTRESTLAYHGGAALAFTSQSDSTKWVYQDHPVTAGTEYVFEAWALVPEGATVFLRVSWYQTPDASGAAFAQTDSIIELQGPLTEWTLLTTGRIAAPPTAASARFRLMLNPAGAQSLTAYFDAALLVVAPPLEPTPTPEPDDTATPTRTQAAPTLTPTPTRTPSIIPTIDGASEQAPPIEPVDRVEPTPAIPNNLLFNPGFDNTPDGVTVAGWDNFGGTLTRETDTVRSGQASVALTSETDSTKWVHQVRPVVAGEEYVFEAWTQVPEGLEAFLRVSWYESSDGSGENFAQTDSIIRVAGPSDGWVLLTTGKMIAPEGANSARFRLMVSPIEEIGATGRAATEPRTAYFDEAALVEAQGEEPTPVGTLGEATETPPVDGTPTPEPTEQPAPGVFWNGGFEVVEDGRPAGWTAVFAEIAADETVQRSGERSLRIASEDASLKWAEQTVLVDGGLFYRLSGFAYLPAEGEAFLRITWYASEDGSGVPLGSNDSEPALGPASSFRFLTTDAVRAPDGAQSATVRLMYGPGSAGSSAAFFDDVSFEETDEPPTPTPTPTTTPETPTPQTPTPGTPTPGTGTPTSTPTPTATGTPATPTPTATEGPVLGDLLNGGFEDLDGDRPAFWEGTGLVSTDAIARSGSRSAAHTASGDGTRAVTQPIAVEGGRYYRLSAYARFPEGDQIVFLRVAFYASTDASGTQLSPTRDSITEIDAPTGDNWVLLDTGVIRAPSNARSAEIRLMTDAFGNEVTTYWDDVIWEETDAPTATPTGTTTATRTPRPTRTPAPARTPAPTRTPRPASTATIPPLGSIPGDDNLGPEAPGADEYPIRITEVFLEEEDNDGAEVQWFELYNAGDVEVQLKDFSIAANRAADTLPNATLEPGEYIVVAASEDALTGFNMRGKKVVRIRDGKIGNGLALRGDRLILFRSLVGVVDSMSYGNDDSVFADDAPDPPGAGESLERRNHNRDTNSGADWFINTKPSPGGPPEDVPDETREPGRTRTPRPGETEEPGAGETPSDGGPGVITVGGAQQNLDDGGPWPFFWPIMAVLCLALALYLSVVAQHGPRHLGKLFRNGHDGGTPP